MTIILHFAHTEKQYFEDTIPWFYKAKPSTSQLYFFAHKHPLCGLALTDCTVTRSKGILLLIDRLSPYLRFQETWRVLFPYHIGRKPPRIQSASWFFDNSHQISRLCHKYLSSPRWRLYLEDNNIRRTGSMTLIFR